MERWEERQERGGGRKRWPWRACVGVYGGMGHGGANGGRRKAGEARQAAGGLQYVTFDTMMRDGPRRRWEGR